MEVGRRQHIQSSKPDIAVLGKRGRRARTNMEESDLAFWQNAMSWCRGRHKMGIEGCFLNAKVLVANSHRTNLKLFW